MIRRERRGNLPLCDQESTVAVTGGEGWLEGVSSGRDGGMGERVKPLLMAELPVGEKSNEYHCVGEVRECDTSGLSKA